MFNEDERTGVEGSNAMLGSKEDNTFYRAKAYAYHFTVTLMHVAT